MIHKTRTLLQNVIHKKSICNSNVTQIQQGWEELMAAWDRLN